MTEDQIRAAVRAEITPLREDFAEFRGEVVEKLDIIGKRLEVATVDRQEMMRILRLLEWRRSGGRAPAATPQAASAKK